MAQHVASKEPHSMALHGPAGRATMHGIAWKTCKWIPNLTDLHGTASKVPVLMDPDLAPLMELNLHSMTLPMASIELRCTDLHGRPLARIRTDLP